MSTPAASHPLQRKALGGPLLTFPFVLALAIFLVSVPFIIWRFTVGLGPATALSDGYPWGFWIAFDVVTGTALASGGFAVAFVVFVLNRWQYHGLVRPAVLTAALGYTIALLALVVDVGRPWNFWKVPFFWGDWNMDSALLEVALCVSLYTLVLWIEASPALLERLENSKRVALRRFAKGATRVMDLVLPWLIAGGVLLPMMHQSSLGSLLILTGHKVDPLWQTPMLPLLFVISSFLMGIGAVTVESALASYFFRRPRETTMLTKLSKVALIAMLLYVVMRLNDVVVRGLVGRLFSFDTLAVFFWIELALFLVPIVMLWPGRKRKNLGLLMRAAILFCVAGALYRFDAFLVAFDPGPGWSYFPAVPEFIITIGLVALEIVAYLFIVQRFPVLRGRWNGHPVQPELGRQS